MSTADRSAGSTFTADGETYFSGTVNGVVFYGPGFFEGRPAESRRCPERDATPAQLDASSLQFTSDYIPAGFTLALQFGSTCDDVVQAVSKVWRSGSGDVLRASHGTGDAWLISAWTADQIKTATIGGRPTVAVESDEFEFGHHVIILMRDSDGTVWHVSSAGKMRDALKVAVGLHKK